MSVITESNYSSDMVSPRELVPDVNDKAELEALLEGRGISGKNEVQRSNMYRIPVQVDFLRDYVKGLPADAPLSVLNIGPANAEEASVIASVAKNGNVLDRTSISYVDLVPLDMVVPVTSYGKNFLGEARVPPRADINCYVMESGTWNLIPEIQTFISDSLKGPDNHFKTAVESYCKLPDTKKYMVVTFNNVAQYLGRGLTQYDNPFYKTEGDFSKFQATLLSVAEKTDVGGVLLTQITTKGLDSRSSENRGTKLAVDKYLHEGTNFDDVFDTINHKEGIYKRKSNIPLVMKKPIAQIS
ncbi:MAG: hypothetical protein WCO33_01080 [bacterium]